MDPADEEDTKDYLYTVNVPDPGNIETGEKEQQRDIQARADEHTHFYFSRDEITETVSPVELDSLIASQPRNFETVLTDFEKNPNGIELETTFLTLVIYVDDIFLICSSRSVLNYARKRLLKMYKGTYEETPDSFLGHVFKPDADGHIEMTQDALIKKALRGAGMEKLKHKRKGRVPIHEFIHPAPKSDDEKEMSKGHKFKSPSHHRLRMNGKLDLMVLLGECNYLCHTQPYLRFAHGQLARVMTNPTNAHIEIAKTMMCYMVGRIGHGVKFRKDIDQGLYVFVDSNFGVEVYTGIAVYLNGGVIYSKSLRQKFASRSTFDAELAGLSEGVRIALYYRAVARDLGLNIEKAVVFGDNEAAVNEAKAVYNGVSGVSKLRHHRIRLNWLKQQYQRGLVDIQHVVSADNVADILTKPITAEKHWDDLYGQLMGETQTRKIVEYCDETKTLVQ